MSLSRATSTNRRSGAPRPLTVPANPAALTGTFHTPNRLPPQSPSASFSSHSFATAIPSSSTVDQSAKKSRAGRPVGSAQNSPRSPSQPQSAVANNRKPPIPVPSSASSKSQARHLPSPSSNPAPSLSPVHLTTDDLLKEDLAELSELFKIVDRDGGGTISQDEFLELLHTMSMKPTKSQMELLFQEIDYNGNGQIEFEEFFTFMTHTVIRSLDRTRLKKLFRSFIGISGTRTHTHTHTHTNTNNNTNIFRSMDKIHKNDLLSLLLNFVPDKLEGIDKRRAVEDLLSHIRLDTLNYMDFNQYIERNTPDPQSDLQAELEEVRKMFKKTDIDLESTELPAVSPSHAQIQGQQGARNGEFLSLTRSPSSMNTVKGSVLDRNSAEDSDAETEMEESVQDADSL